jgi:Cytochrome c554 and c-prime
MNPIPSASTTGFKKNLGGTTTFEAGDSRFSIERRGEREFHKETQLDGEGRVVAEVEAEITYALGSGTRGVSYLLEHDGRLFQSPIAWYGQKRKWDLAPGYERRKMHFDRVIEPACLFCHANRVRPVDQAVNRYEKPIFEGHAIGCERCHGPVALHVQGKSW